MKDDSVYIRKGETAKIAVDVEGADFLRIRRGEGLRLRIPELGWDRRIYSGESYKAGSLRSEKLKFPKELHILNDTGSHQTLEWTLSCGEQTSNAFRPLPQAPFPMHDESGQRSGLGPWEVPGEYLKVDVIKDPLLHLAFARVLLINHGLAGPDLALRMQPSPNHILFRCAPGEQKDMDWMSLGGLDMGPAGLGGQLEIVGGDPGALITAHIWMVPRL